MASKTHNPPFVRFVRQVSNGQSRPKSAFISMMADNELRLKSAEWNPAQVATSTTTTNAVTATDGVWDADAGDWSTKPSYTKYIDERYDAYLQGGDGVVSTATMCGYAGIAAYRFKLPSAWTDTTVETVEIPVSVDKYLRAGVRVSLVFSDSETPSNDWDVIRGTAANCWKTDSEASEQEGVVSFGYLGKTASPYLTASIVEYGTITVPVADIPSLSGGDKPTYMWVYLTPEDFTGRWTMYSKKSTRNYGIEGSAVIVGDGVAVTFADEVEADPDVPGSTGFAVFHGGVGPYVPKGSICAFECAVRSDANLIIEADGSQADLRNYVGGLDTASAVGRLYERLFGGLVDPLTSGGSSPQPGASFNVVAEDENRRHVSVESDRPNRTAVLRIEAAPLLVPFVFPTGFVAGKVTLSFPSFFSGDDVSDGARFNVFLAGKYLTSLTEEEIRAPGLYDGTEPPFALLGTVSGGASAAFRLPPHDGRFGTFVITGFLPPERYDLEAGGSQGTGPTPFLPDVFLS